MAPNFSCFVSFEPPTITGLRAEARSIEAIACRALHRSGPLQFGFGDRHHVLVYNLVLLTPGGHQAGARPMINPARNPLRPGMGGGQRRLRKYRPLHPDGLQVVTKVVDCFCDGQRGQMIGDRDPLANRLERSERQLAPQLGMPDTHQRQGGRRVHGEVQEEPQTLQDMRREQMALIEHQHGQSAVLCGQRPQGMPDRPFGVVGPRRDRDSESMGHRPISMPRRPGFCDGQITQLILGGIQRV